MQNNPVSSHVISWPETRFFHAGLPLSRRQALTAALAGVATLAGCARPLAPLRLGTIVFPGYELLFLAREKGWLQPGLVRLIELQNSSDSVRALAAGELEGAMLTMDELISARAGGVDLRAVAVLDTSDGADQVLARPGVTLANLERHSVAAEDNSVGALMMASLLKLPGCVWTRSSRCPSPSPGQRRPIRKVWPTWW